MLGVEDYVSVFNIVGQKIYEEKDVTSIDIKNWESGIYFVRSGKKMVKIIKQ